MVASVPSCGKRSVGDNPGLDLVQVGSTVLQVLADLADLVKGQVAGSQNRLSKPADTGDTAKSFDLSPNLGHAGHVVVILVDKQGKLGRTDHGRLGQTVNTLVRKRAFVVLFRQLVVVVGKAAVGVKVGSVLDHIRKLDGLHRVRAFVVNLLGAVERTELQT